MKFKLLKKQYQLLRTIDFSELNGKISFIDKMEEVTVDDDALSLFQMIISEEIDRNGLTDDQNDVTPHGRELYALYDAVYDQI